MAMDTEPPPPPATVPLRPRFAQRLRAYFIAGILITAPIGITIYLAKLFLDFVDARVVPLIPASYNPDSYLPFSVPGIGLVILLVVHTLIGALTAHYAGRWFLQTSVRVLARLRVIRTPSPEGKHVFESPLPNQPAFRGVGRVEYPRH